jgi:hypothetical protein
MARQPSIKIEKLYCSLDSVDWRECGTNMSRVYGSHRWILV